jgi:hypothetical protein
MKKVTAAMLLTAALSAGTAAFAQAGTNPTGQVDNPSAQTQNQKPVELKDIPAGHWASEAIKVAANCGVVRGFPDGTFRGNEPVTRYQAAAIVARLLDAVRNGECGIPRYATKAELDAAIAAVKAGQTPAQPAQPAIDTSKFLTAADLVVLQNAIQELAADLAQLGVRVAELEDNAVTADDLARVEEIATQARDLAEAAAAAAQEANDTAVSANDAAAGAQEAADSAAAAAEAAQQTADDALAAAAAAQQAADDAAAGVASAQQTADDAINAAANAQQAADDAMAVAMAAQELADAAASAAETAQQTADDALAAAAAAQQTADDAAAAAEIAQQTADDALGAAATAQAAADDAVAVALAAQESADAAAAAAGVAQQTADDALALAQAAQPAGDYATTDDLAGVAETAQQARDLAEAAAAALETLELVSPEAIQDLTDQVEATSIAADTALAQARELQDRYDELNGRIDDLGAQLGELGAVVEGQADSIAALNDLVVLLNQDVLSLQDRVTQLERGLAVANGAVEDLAASAASQEDLESLREFTTLLRRDQTALADRVGELEARVGRVEGRVTAVEGRVTALENNAFTVTGTVGLSYRRALVWREDGTGLGFDFDIDRLAFPNGGFGFGFSSGTGDGSISTNARTFSDFAGGDGGTNGTRSVGVTGQSAQVIDQEGRIAPSATLVFTFKPRALTGATTNNLGNNFSVGLVLTMVPAGTTATQANGVQTTNGGPFTNLSGDRGTSLSFIGFSLSSLALTYNIGAAPLFINFGVNAPYAFTKFGMNTSGLGDGFVASINGAGLLPLNPTLTAVYQSRSGANADDFYIVGAKGTLSLIPGLTGSAYVALAGEDVIGVGAVRDSVTMFGFEFGGKLLGFVDLAGEWNTSSLTQTPGTSTNRVASFVTVGANFDPFTISGNWRYVDPAWGSATTDGSGMFTDLSTNDGPYTNNQNGFGITLGAKNLLGFLNVNGYFDTRTRVNTGADLGNGPARPAGINYQSGLLQTSMDTNGGATVNSSADFGVVVGLALAGFDFQGYFFSEAENNNGGTGVRGRTDLGLSLANAGKLIPGVNVVAGFNSSSDTVPANAGSRTSLYAYVDTSFNLAGFTVAPKAYFGNQSGTGTLASNITQLGGSVTANGDFLLGSKVALGIAFDSRTGAANASTWLFSAGLSWANGPLPGSTFGVSFATRTDVGRSGTGVGPSFAAPVPFGSWGADAAASVVLTGLDFNFAYYGLAFRYGIFNHTNVTGAPVVTWGSRFTIAYSLKF